MFKNGLFFTNPVIPKCPPFIPKDCGLHGGKMPVMGAFIHYVLTTEFLRGKIPQQSWVSPCGEVGKAHAPTGAKP
jgi:hypothetical protein